MQGNRVDLLSFDRACLRRLARQLQRREAPVGYRIGPAWASTLWIAANELPLVDERVPFLIARTGRRSTSSCAG
jgi:hypothetical protein